ncbi:MAG: type II toxin-antitoxin system VapC family toxin [Fimbriimonadales bacterium]
MVKTIVADASVLLKAYLHDEEETAAVDAMPQDLSQDRLSIAVPYLSRYEISNALWAAARQGRISPEDALRAQQEFLQINLQYFASEAVETRALELALRHNRSVYDCSYVALAEQMGVWFFTGDRRLYNALGPHLPFVRWIGDYDWDALPEALQYTG